MDRKNIRIDGKIAEKLKDKHFGKSYSRTIAALAGQSCGRLDPCGHRVKGRHETKSIKISEDCYTTLNRMKDDLFEDEDASVNDVLRCICNG